MRQEHTVQTMHNAAQEIEPAALKWLLALCHLKDFDDVTDSLMSCATSKGRLSTLRYLQASPYSSRMNAQTSLGAHRHLNCLKWLLEQEPPCPLHSDVLMGLAGLGDLNTLAWLRAHSQVPQHVWHCDVPVAAVEHGNMEVLRWLRDHDPPCKWDEGCTMAAAASSNSSILQWLRAQNPPCPWSSGCCTVAAKNGDIPLLGWLRTQDPPCPWDRLCCRVAAKNGDIPLLGWLRTQHPPCPWDEYSTLAAVHKQDMTTLQWLRAQSPPAPWSAACTYGAATSGHLIMLEWLVQEGCAFSSDELYRNAAYYNHGHVLEWLHTRGLPVPKPGMGWTAPGQAPIPILMFLGDIGYPMSMYSRPKLVQARKTFCTFYGLLRWCSSAVAGKGAHAAFDCLATDHTCQNLLVHLSLLPQELITRIAVAAELQHGLSLTQNAASMLGQPSG
ncbi:hypothetical protein WJX74_005909 [Apatococcus lobatus]|uniref:Ankyrin repeat domain-containing protein n=1 Tax=Apatococcus lobatus TaxID=904363 RepID=A0AAW1RAZ4_9CHLO